ncbi:hypothetical protein K1J50_17280, partial [Caldovatus sp. SYSU G05006]
MGAAQRSAAGAAKGESDAHQQAIGRALGGRTAGIRALRHHRGRLPAILLGAITVIATLIPAIALPGEAVGDTGCDAQHPRRLRAARGTGAAVPSTGSRKVALPQAAGRRRRPPSGPSPQYQPSALWIDLSCPLEVGERSDPSGLGDEVV